MTSVVSIAGDARSITSDLYKLFISTDVSAAKNVPDPTNKPAALVRARRANTSMPQAIGCSFSNTTKTVIAMPVTSVEHLDALLRLAQPNVATALSNDNSVHLVFMGASASTLPRLIKFSQEGVIGVPMTNVHLVHGDTSPLQTVSRDQVMQYLERCKPVVVIGGEADDEEETQLASGATWFVRDAVDLPTDAHRKWVREVNRRWVESLPTATTTGMDYITWLRLMPLPVAEANIEHGVLHNGAVLVRVAQDRGPARFCRLLQWHENVPHSMGQWAEMSPLSWHVSTWCNATAIELRPPAMIYIDKSELIPEHQNDVECILFTLMQYCDVTKLRGRIGPCVVGGRKRNGVLRTVLWTLQSTNSDNTDSIETSFLTLLPEAYVRHVFSDYNVDFMDLSSAGPQTLLQSFIVLPHGASMLMRFPGLSGAEHMEAADEMGRRVWKLGIRPKADSFKSLRTTSSGQQVDTIENQTVFYTASTGDDPFEGLCVKWVFVSGLKLVTLDVENEV